MLGKIAVWRHLVLAAVVIALAVLGFTGLIGGGRYPERFDDKLVIVRPDGEDGVRITEVVDQDFGSNDRHGYQRDHPQRLRRPHRHRRLVARRERRRPRHPGLLRHDDPPR